MEPTVSAIIIIVEYMMYTTGQRTMQYIPYSGQFKGYSPPATSMNNMPTLLNLHDCACMHGIDIILLY